jgi:L-ascorbate metabolism protein UlaG (beta-lactamase superfamily)
MRWILCGLLALLAGTVPGTAGTLQFQFIGNAAVSITDGRTTLLVDFPYQSGAMGYMTYDSSTVQIQGTVACLFTHSHRDHFMPELIKDDWVVLGPAQVLREVPARQTIPFSKTMQYKDITIHAIQSAHSNVEHFSYHVSWHGKRIFFTGDTSSISAAAQQAGLDVLFIAPWQYRQFAAMGRPLGAQKVVIYHHKIGEKLPPCEECLVPEQGEMFEIETFF